MTTTPLAHVLPGGNKRLRRRDVTTAPSGSRSRHASCPLISVILPVYNQASYLPESVGSVLAQKGIDLELIVIDDGSTDDPRSKLQLFLTDPRLRIVTQKNAGLSRALNRGLIETRGELLTWTSADNVYAPGALRKLADFIVANPAVGLAFANVRLIDEQGLPVTISDYRPQDQCASDRSVLLLPYSTSALDELPDNFVNACFLFRRCHARAAGGYDPKLNGFEDYDFWLRLQEFAKVAHIDSDEPLYSYRLHPNTLTATLEADDLRRRVEGHVQSFCIRRGELGTEPPPAKSLEQLLRSCLPPEADVVRRPALLLHPCHKELFLPKASEILEASHAPRRTEIERRLVVTPALKRMEIIRRARDCDFGAVVPNHDSKATLLIFCPDADSCPSSSKGLAHAALDRVAELVRFRAELTFVLLCRSKSERQAADALHLSIQPSSNLRIVDVTDEPAPDRSIMYVLSSVSAVLSLWPVGSPPERVLETRAEAYFAALAARPILAAFDRQPLKALFPAAAAWNTTPGAEPLGAVLADAPHLILFDSLLSGPLASPRETVSPPGSWSWESILTTPDLVSLEQWIEGTSWASLAQRATAFACASM